MPIGGLENAEQARVLVHSDMNRYLMLRAQFAALGLRSLASYSAGKPRWLHKRKESLVKQPNQAGLGKQTPVLASIAMKLGLFHY